MSWPFLYFAGDRLSSAELACARLDGDVVEVGDAYMPADAVETRELRAGSLRERVPPTLAVARESAAWVHGAVPDAPARHTVQRRSPVRLHHVIDPRLSYRDQPLGPEAAVMVGGVWVTTPARTLADLVRALHGGEPVRRHVEALLQWRVGLAQEAMAVLESGSTVHYKRPALAFLRAIIAEEADAQDEVTRYTS
jgi:hypothetical protein